MIAEWESKKFEECLDRVRTPVKVPKKKFLNEGLYPVVSQEQQLINGYWDDEEDVYQVQSPVVIFGDHTRVLKFIDFNFVMGADGVKILKPKQFLYSRYFYYYLQAFSVQSLGYARHYRLLKELSIFYPPLPEQKRIVAILDAAFEAITTAVTNAEKNLANARELFESYLNSVFSQRSEGRRTERLQDVCQIKPPKREAKQRLSDTDLVSFVPMSDLGVCKKELTLCDERPLSEVAGSYTYFAENDVLLAKITPCFENGKLGISRDLKNGIGFGSSEYIVFRSKGDVDPEYLFYFLSQASFRVAGARVMSGAVGHKRVPKEFIENYRIPLPDLLEQKSIVAFLDELSDKTKQLDAIYQQKLTALAELKQSLLKKAFAGELTAAVPSLEAEATA